MKMTLDEARKRLFDTGFLLGGRRRRAALKVLLGSPGPEGVLALAAALGQGHPHPKEILNGLGRLAAPADAEKVEALWDYFSRTPGPALAGVLTQIGWPPGRAVPAKTARDLLALANEGADKETLQAVTRVARALPVADEVGNDAIYAAWIRSQSPELETLITEQRRQSASPALEALHALVTGRLERYAALKDQDGVLLVQAFAMAPEPFRSRLAQTVAASPDRGIKEAYRRALSSGAVDKAQSVENLKLVGDEDGLFEQTRHLRLLDVLGLCERWAAVPGRPAHPAHRAAVDKAVSEYRSLGAFKVEPGPELPDGMVDLFDFWRDQEPSDADLRADLTAEDPFRKARGLYLGQERNLVEAQRLTAAATSEHWPERLIARLLDPAALAGAPEDHVLWVNACAGDAGLLAAPIGGTPEDYARHSARFQQASGPAAARTRGLLSILCTFQGVFVAGGITVDETGEATDRGAVELEDAGEVEFE
ncbi:hypothetical protein [Candidatus Thiodictyon syntrophicum]|jgi:hypothetical protein|uniref:hypothetical protein n=1 Tax=Candidatus Thiodictyon syntrophicum TaxID=1166950 RepID=UPI000C2D63FC|nr:hypothetical protein [Candidatus Thiodictyon syntrophicum]